MRVNGLVLAAVLAVAAGACSNGGAEPVQGLDFEALRGETTDFQREILADGKVGPDEYERAVFAQWECVKGAGFSPDQPEWSKGQFGFGNEMTAADDAQMDELLAKYDAEYERCDHEFASEVGLVWVAQLAMSPAERDRARADVIACLQSAGIEVPAKADDDQIFAAMTSETVDQWGDCVDQFPGYFTVMPPDG
ncbi:MAG: hypothetical protein LBC97_11080 [Bifidobacteriaceae bacterium]|jgi:hypothetical protein|nr:hypothetical protein [Bifidobacteriaceae bacterium]